MVSHDSDKILNFYIHWHLTPSLGSIYTNNQYRDATAYADP